MTDSGQFGAATGDGIYTGSFTPLTPGEYAAVLSITGTSLAGNAFSRTTSAEFIVTQSLASFSAFEDARQEESLEIVAHVNVETPGKYEFGINLEASNHKVIRGVARADVETGPQRMEIRFPKADVFGLGVGGPYKLSRAQLHFVAESGSLIADSRADAGVTSAYTLTSLAPGIYFTGQNSP